MMSMRVLGFAHDSGSETPVLVLRQIDGEVVLPIWIGQAEAVAIAASARDEDSPRPLSHDLLLRCVNAMGGRVTSFSVTGLEEGVFIGTLDVLNERTGELVSLDCRPSDGIAVALRSHIPVLVDESVLEAAGAQRRRNERPGDFWEKLGPKEVLWDTAAAESEKAAPEQVLKESISQQTTSEDTSQAELLQTLEPVSKRVM